MIDSEYLRKVSGPLNHDILVEVSQQLLRERDAYREVAFSRAVKRDDPKGWDIAYDLVDADADTLVRVGNEQAQRMAEGEGKV